MKEVCLYLWSLLKSNLSCTAYLVVCYTAAKFTLRSVKFEQTSSEQTTLMRRVLFSVSKLQMFTNVKKQMLSSKQTNKLSGLSTISNNQQITGKRSFIFNVELYRNCVEFRQYVNM